MARQAQPRAESVVGFMKQGQYVKPIILYDAHKTEINMTHIVEQRKAIVILYVDREAALQLRKDLDDWLASKLPGTHGIAMRGDLHT